MPHESSSRRGRRLVLVGLLLVLLPMTAKSREGPACETHNTVLGTLVCIPIDLLRILGPLARYLLLTGRPEESLPALSSNSVIHPLDDPGDHAGTG